MRLKGALMALALVGCGDKDCEDSCAVDDSADDTGADDTSADDTSADDTSTDDSAEPDACPEPVATFVGDDGSTLDLTEALLTGAYTTLDVPGTLSVCPGTWFARLLVRSQVRVEGLGQAPEDTVLSGGESGTILDVGGEGTTLAVHNLTLDRGAGLDVEHNSGGGGIYCGDFGAVTVSHAVFSQNFANDGAALYAEDCLVDVSDSEFVNNLAEDDGGAFTLWFSEGTLTDVVFHDNEGLDGGAVALFYSTLSAVNTTIRDNVATNFAGGMWVSRSDLVMEDSRFENNQNSGTQGGGLLVQGSADLTRVSFEGNGAPLGGGLFVYYQAEVQGQDCDFSSNSPEDIYAADYTDAGGVSYSAGSGYSFSCAANVCTEG